MDYRQITDQMLIDDRYTDLIKACRQALATCANDTNLLYKLALSLERTHNLSEARAVADDILRIDPLHLYAPLTLAKIDKREGDLESARVRLEGLQNRRSSAAYKSELFHDLGDIYDLLGEYPKAFYYYHYGNLEMSKTTKAKEIDPGAIFHTINSYVNTFTRDFMKGWGQAEPDDGLASPIFLVGFPRSGTTLTEQIIASSGQVIPTHEQPLIYELMQMSHHVLGRRLYSPVDLGELNAHEITMLRAQYWELAQKTIQTDKSIDGMYMLDKLPLNLIEIAIIHRLFPRARVVIIIRDPRDSCLSCFMKYFELNAAMVHFLNIDNAARLYTCVMDYWLRIRSFIQQPIFEIRYESLVDDHKPTVRSLIDFLGLEWSDRIWNFDKHVDSRYTRTPSYSSITQPIYRRSVGRWMNYAGFMKQSREILAPYVNEFGYEK